MTLSNDELRVLEELEIELSRPSHPQLAHALSVTRAHWRALLFTSLVIPLVALLAVSGGGALVAVPAGILGVCLGCVLGTAWAGATERTRRMK